MDETPGESDRITDAMIRDFYAAFPDKVDHFEYTVDVGQETISKYGEMLGGSRPVSKKTAYRMLNAGKIKAFRIGRSYRIPKVNVIRFLQNETPEDCNTVNATIDSVE